MDAVIYFCFVMSATCLADPNTLTVEVENNTLCTKVAQIAAARFLPDRANFLGFRCGNQFYGPPPQPSVIVPDDGTLG